MGYGRAVGPHHLLLLAATAASPAVRAPAPTHVEVTAGGSVLVGTVSGNGRDRYREQTAVSTIPLPELLARTRDLPPALRQLRDAFEWCSLVVGNLGLREERPTTMQRLYVADPAVPFHKVVFNSNSAPGCAPPGHASVSVEISKALGDVAEKLLAEAKRLGDVPRALELANQIAIEQAKMRGTQG